MTKLGQKGQGREREKLKKRVYIYISIEIIQSEKQRGIKMENKALGELWGNIKRYPRRKENETRKRRNIGQK